MVDNVIVSPHQLMYIKNNLIYNMFPSSVLIKAFFFVTKVLFEILSLCKILVLFLSQFCKTFFLFLFWSCFLWVWAQTVFMCHIHFMGFIKILLTRLFIRHISHPKCTIYGLADAIKIWAILRMHLVSKKVVLKV